MKQLQTLKQKIVHSLLWNSFEAVAYQLILCVHQCLLFWCIDPSLYAIQGTFFAVAFLGITLFNVSLESSMISSFFSATQSQDTFRRFFLSTVATQTFILFFGTLLFGYCMLHVTLPFFAKEFFTPFWILILAIFITTEGTKKNLRALLHLAFENKPTAYIEVSNIIGYVSCIWFLKLTKVRLDSISLTVPFLIVSVITNCLLLRILYHYYATLPFKSSNKYVSFSLKATLKNRLFLYANELSRLIFSSNFLLPFFACTSGLKELGVAAFINSITHSATFFIQKIFGASGAAVFAQTKQLSLKAKQDAFMYLNQKCFYVLFSILILFSVNFPHVIRLKIGQGSLESLTLTYIFFLAHFLENIFVLYERIFAAEEKAHYTLLCNLASLVSCCLLVILCKNASFSMLILGCMTLRLGAFLSLAILAKRIWGLSFVLSFRLIEWIAPLIFSCLCFIALLFQ